jgi:NitT/TauT family transport system substrate-binding protein
MFKREQTILEHLRKALVKKYIPAFLLVFIMLQGCKNTTDKKTEKLTVATLRGPSAISMITMIDSLKDFKNQSIEFKIKNEPVQIRPMLFQEKASFAVVPTNMASILYNKGVNYKVAAIPVWGTLYLFGQENINDWEELKGKKIHLMAKGMTPDIMFKFLLKKHGIDPLKDVDLDYSFPTHIELANAVAAGKAKLGVISEPLVSMVMAKNKNVKPLFSLNKEWKKTTDKEIPQTALLVHKELASKNPEIVNAFLSEYEKSVKWVNANPEKAGSLIVKHNILKDRQVAEQSIPRCNMHFKNIKETQNQVHEYLKIFYNMNPKTIGGKLPDEEFYFKQ